MNERMQDRAIECQSVGTPEVGEGLKTVRLSPWGKVESTNGDFIVDDEGVAEILRTFAEHGTDLPIDVEHSALDKSLPPMQRGAVGWIEKLWGESGKGLYSLVKWSDTGKALIQSDSFRFLSPVFLIRKDDRKVVGVHSAAITNKPALPRMERLAASQNANAETTAAAEENAAIAQSVREALKLPANANKDAIELALSVRSSGGAESAELATMREAESQRVATEMVQGYIRTQQLNPNDKPAVAAATRLAMSDPGTLEAIFKNLPPQIPTGRTTAPTNRQMAIIHAEREYRETPGHQRATSLKAFVAQALRDKGLEPLTNDETVTLSA